MTCDLDYQIAALREEVVRLNHTCQQAWAISPQAAVRAEATYNAEFDRLGRLIRRRLQRQCHG